jgi:hypothetical protein
MGLDALNCNGITTKICYLIRDSATVLPNDPFKRVRCSRIWLFVVIQLFAFGATMAITQTVGVFCFLVRSPASRLSTDSDIASCGRVSNHHLTAHPFAQNDHPQASVHRGGIGDP